ncbi:MAG: DUF4239 domain-containing protein [Chloroflexi bacterium]|nr:DUF4239 domain-containing protein [Chloroflexota bacterium]
MINFILSLPLWIGSIIAMGLSTVSGLAVYFVSYKFISRYESKDLKEVASSLFRVVGILISLMLSLGFGEVVTQWRETDNIIQQEAVVITDSFLNLQRYDVETTRDMRVILIDYTQAVIDDDWPALANNNLGQRAGALYREFSTRVIELEPANSVQEELRSQIMSNVALMTDYRLVRLNNAMGKPPAFVYIIIFGFLITMVCFGVYQPKTPVVVLISLYTIFVGLVLYIILSLSDPFQGGFGMEPNTFEQLVEGLRSMNK